jgi:D-arabinose 1-dehydrogenase-like Zn-dependent alcohol dehydrogenase
MTLAVSACSLRQCFSFFGFSAGLHKDVSPTFWYFYTMKIVPSISEYLRELHIPPPMHPFFYAGRHQDSMETMKRKIGPLKHEFYSIFVTSQLFSKLEINNAPVKANLFIISPFKIIEFDIRGQSFEGLFILFDRDFISTNALWTNFLTDFPFFGLGESSPLTQQRWANGSWSEQFICPVQNLHIIPKGSRYTAEKWASLNYLNISYGALLKADFEPGMTVVVNGATGGLGSGVVLLAVALGAAKVIAVGKDDQALAKLKLLSDDRIDIVISTNDAANLLPGQKEPTAGADILIDALGKLKVFEPTLAGIQMLKRGGVAIFLGGVDTDIPLNYKRVMQKELQIRGNFMYPPQVPGELIKMIDAGLINLDLINTVSYSLEAFEEAFTEAEQAPPLTFVMLTCRS